MTEAIAPTGHIWVCAACGKTAANYYGDRPSNGWDESCFLHAVLVKVDDIVKRSPSGGRVLKLRDGAITVHRQDVEPREPGTQ